MSFPVNGRKDAMSNEAESVQRLHEVRAAIARAARDFGRDSAEITLVAVSKTFPQDAVAPILADGQRIFGENYVREAADKWGDLRGAYPDVELHLIGPLQSNKARDAVRLFDVIHSLDRDSLAKELAKEIARSESPRPPRLLVQINTGEEAQKGGVRPGEADAFIDRCRTRHGLAIEGLMCIPPFDAPPSPHFALLNTIAARNGLKTLSMGMSADFEAAIQLGATHVRVGSAIFGSRS